MRVWPDGSGRKGLYNRDKLVRAQKNNNKIIKNVKKRKGSFVMMNILKRLVSEKKGQGLAEYGLILALVSLAVVLALTTLGTDLGALLGRVSAQLTGAN